MAKMTLFEPLSGFVSLALDQRISIYNGLVLYPGLYPNGPTDFDLGPTDLKKFSDLSIGKIPPAAPGKRVETFDALATGLVLRVTDKGVKSFALVTRIDGRPARITIGQWPRMKIAEAREAARTLLDRVKAGEDPRQDAAKAKEAENASAEARRRAEAEAAKRKVAVLIDRFAVDHLSKRRSGAEMLRVLNREIRPLWGDRDVAEITRRDVNELIDAIAARGSPVMANRTLAHVRKLFNWAISRDLIDENPATKIERRGVERDIDRVLDPRELVAVWRACDDIGWPFGPLVRLLILTGQREMEVAGMSRAELDGAIWRLPRGRVKNASGHVVYLSAQARAIIDALPGTGAAGLLFSLTDRPPSGFAKCKRRLSAAALRYLIADGIEGAPVIRRSELLTLVGKPASMVNAAAARLGIDEVDLARMVAKVDRLEGGLEIEDGDVVYMRPWRIHDLRRTAATGLADLGVAPHVIERILNHKSGIINGVAAVYNRSAYEHDCRVAMDRWAAHIDQLLNPPADDASSNVIRMAR